MKPKKKRETKILPTNDTISFGSRLKDIAKHYDLLASDLAKKLEVTPVSIFRWFSGTRGITLLHLVRIKKEFPDISLNWLINNQGEMLETNPLPCEYCKQTTCNHQLQGGLLLGYCNKCKLHTTFNL